tara:strand:- start:49639 stop:50223 length:585 start_codon:yes stop_codon:yes gene_type:complete
MKEEWATKYFYHRHRQEPHAPYYRKRKDSDGSVGFLQLSWPQRRRIRNMEGLSDGAKLTWIDLLTLCYTQVPLTEFTPRTKLAPGCMIISRGNLIRELGIPPSTAKKHIRALLNVGVLFCSEMHSNNLCLWVIDFTPYPSEAVQKGWKYSDWTAWIRKAENGGTQQLPDDLWPENEDERMAFLGENGWGPPDGY